MNFKKLEVQACCGKKSTVYQVSSILTKDTIITLTSIGFKELTHFTKSGILCVESEFLFLSGPIGSDRLQVRCKKGDCLASLKDLEESLKQI